MMADKCETDDANCAEYTGLDDGEPFGRVTFIFGWDVGALDEDGGDDDEHSEEGEAGSAGELVDVTVEGKWVGYGDGAECDDELAVGEDGEDGCGMEFGENGPDDVRYCIT
jgi:hypothetical protein